METAMGSKPLGAYIRALRQHMRPKVTQKRLADIVGAASNTIYRIEAGMQEPQEYLASILTAIGGRIKDVSKLQSTEASVDLAMRLADEAVTERQLLDWANTDEKRRRLLHRIREMSSDDPELQARLEGYLDRLQDR
jgi:DNA-binding XRE family transcriptional regulator